MRRHQTTVTRAPSEAKVAVLAVRFENQRFMMHSHQASGYTLWGTRLVHQVPCSVLCKVDGSPWTSQDQTNQVRRECCSTDLHFGHPFVLMSATVVSPSTRQPSLSSQAFDLAAHHLVPAEASAPLMALMALKLRGSGVLGPEVDVSQVESAVLGSVKRLVVTQ